MADVDLDQHLDLLGTLSVVMGALVVAAGVVASFFTLFAASFLAFGKDVPTVMGVLFGFVALAMFTVGIVGIVGGRDLRARRGRGRIIVLVMGALSLFSFPVGTAFGVYAIWVLTRPGVEAKLAQTSTATP